MANSPVPALPSVRPPDKQQPPASGGSVFDASFWTTFLSGALKDLQVYGFLLLLVAIGLYGLFAPQASTVIRVMTKPRGKAAEEESGE